MSAESPVPIKSFTLNASGVGRMRRIFSLFQSPSSRDNFEGVFHPQRKNGAFIVVKPKESEIRREIEVRDAIYLVYDGSGRFTPGIRIDFNNPNDRLTVWVRYCGSITEKKMHTDGHEEVLEIGKGITPGSISNHFQIILGKGELTDERYSYKVGEDGSIIPYRRVIEQSQKDIFHTKSIIDIDTRGMPRRSINRLKKQIRRARLKEEKAEKKRKMQASFESQKQPDRKVKIDVDGVNMMITITSRQGSEESNNYEMNVPVQIGIPSELSVSSFYPSLVIE